MLLRINIVYEYSGDFGYIEKEIDDNHLDTYYKIENFFGKNLVFKVKKDFFDEKNNILIASVESGDAYSAIAKMKYLTLEGINLKTLDITPRYFKENIEKIKKLGFNITLDETYLDYYTNKVEHEEKRSRLQKIFGLNEFKNFMIQ